VDHERRRGDVERETLELAFGGWAGRRGRRAWVRGGRLESRSCERRVETREAGRGVWEEEDEGREGGVSWETRLELGD